MSEDSSIEYIFGEMEEAISKLEAPEVSLEESFTIYQKGMNLLKECNEKIQRIENQITILDQNGDSNES